MKINFVFVFVLFFLKTCAQDIDTIFYQEDGYYRIITKSNFDEISSGLVTEEYKEYTITEHKLIGQKQILIEGQILTELWNNDGKKYYEEYIDNENNLAYQTTWNNQGIKTSQLISSKENRIKINYYENKANSIKELITLNPYSYKFDSLKIMDKKTGLFWAEQYLPSSRKALSSKSTHIHFLSDGIKESEFFFITKIFYAFASKNEYLNYIKTGNKAKIINKRNQVKYGIWKYYNKKNELINEEHFDVYENPLKAIKY